MSRRSDTPLSMWLSLVGGRRLPPSWRNPPSIARLRVLRESARWSPPLPTRPARRPFGPAFPAPPNAPRQPYPPRQGCITRRQDNPATRDGQGFAIGGSDRVRGWAGREGAAHPWFTLVVLRSGRRGMIWRPFRNSKHPQISVRGHSTERLDCHQRAADVLRRMLIEPNR
jgi:hypothetical protein